MGVEEVEEEEVKEVEEALEVEEEIDVLVHVHDTKAAFVFLTHQ